MLKDIKISKSAKTALIIGVIILIIAGAVGFIAYSSLFAAPQGHAEIEQFTVPLSVDRNGGILIDFTLAGSLKEKGFIKSEWGFKRVLGKNEIQPGAYEVSKDMNVWQLVEVLTNEPYMKWVVIPEGPRKEQIAELLADTFGWSDQQKEDWVNKYTVMEYDYIEGVYFPDTYLIPKDETPLQIADRLRAKFNEKFAPYAERFLKENIKWTTALKLASIIQREAAGKEDMPLIAGILWNRLLDGMKLDIDATIQYARDTQKHYVNDPCENTEYREKHSDYCFNPEVLQPTTTYVSEGGWWGPIAVADKKIDSKYNTYLYAGLPPHPICNPGLDAIEAVLNPIETNCFYYLHDRNREIHCAETYEKHLENIDNYLK